MKKVERKIKLMYLGKKYLSAGIALLWLFQGCAVHPPKSPEDVCEISKKKEDGIKLRSDRKKMGRSHWC